VLELAADIRLDIMRWAMEGDESGGQGRAWHLLQGVREGVSGLGGRWWGAPGLSHCRYAARCTGD